MTQSKGFKTTQDMLDYAYDMMERARSGEVTVDQLRSEGYYMKSMVHLVSKRIEYNKHMHTLDKLNNGKDGDIRLKK